jgi:hypothetical protein
VIASNAEELKKGQMGRWIVERKCMEAWMG